MAESFDFQINDLKFRAATSDRFPYARATAPFRKEQFDSAPTVGDQSLTGWWTRGQLSFHRGAGIKYYEVLEGDEVLNRFRDSENVDVFEPGEVTLLPELSDMAIAALDAVPAPLTSGGGAYVLTTSSVVYSGDTSTPFVTSDAAVPTSITSDGQTFYVVNGNKIEFQANPAMARTNYVVNPSFEVDTSNWAAQNAATVMATDGASTRYGTQSCKVTADGTLDVPVVRTTVTGLTIGEQYKVGAWVRNVDTHGGPTTETFTSGFQTWVVPDGVTEVEIEAWGARGGNSWDNTGMGGYGGHAKGTLAVTPGEQLYVYVGDLNSQRGGDGGYGAAGGNGGGHSDVRQGGTSIGYQVLVAGGGGGGGSGSAGGAGGAGGGTSGSAGMNAGNANPGGIGGQGGTPTSGGSGGTYDGASGVRGDGGNGGSNGDTHSGGGGGSGYYGGGGGGYHASVGAGGGGGGGSSYIGGVTGGTTTADVWSSTTGKVTITYGEAAPPVHPIRLQVSESATALETDGAHVDTTTVGEWEYLTFTRTAVAESEYVYLRGVTDASTTDTEFNMDAVMVCEFPFSSDYFDGSQPGCSWTGTPHASTSMWATVDTGGGLVVIATLTDDVFEGAWWGKGRLWAVDSAGRWYTIPVGGTAVTLSSTNAFWTANQSGVRWSFADSPGAAYICNGFDVFAVSLNSDGTVPTLSVPTTTLKVPLGESVSTIAHYLSYLILATSQGVRVALQTTDGALIMGGLTVEGDFSACNRIGLYDTKVYVAGRLEGRGGDTVLCAIDLGDEVADLKPVWSPRWTVTELSSSASGSCVDALGSVYVWGAEALARSNADRRVPAGVLETGYHRMGTLDNKHFQEVLVRTGGSGTVEVFRVDADGMETSLGVMDAADRSKTFNFGLPRPIERVALKFVLTRDAGNVRQSPTLVGYQIKSLPAPVRQRLIKWPLMIQDVVRDRYGVSRGTREGAWTAWSELETLEENDALVTFTDHRTGETGEAYIESLELQTDTPTRGAESGFGGVGYITLRKVG